jgi:hypothetical protein
LDNALSSQLSLLGESGKKGAPVAHVLVWRSAQDVVWVQSVNQGGPTVLGSATAPDVAYGLGVMVKQLIRFDTNDRTIALVKL